MHLEVLVTGQFDYSLFMVSLGARRTAMLVAQLHAALHYVTQPYCY